MLSKACVTITCVEANHPVLSIFQPHEHLRLSGLPEPAPHEEISPSRSGPSLHNHHGFMARHSTSCSVMRHCVRGVYVGYSRPQPLEVHFKRQNVTMVHLFGCSTTPHVFSKSRHGIKLTYYTLQKVMNMTCSWLIGLNHKLRE